MRVVSVPDQEQGWRAPILEHFELELVGAARLTAVADPDRLLAEGATLRELASRGFDFLPYHEPVAFRHAYESGYRNAWDNGDCRTHLVVVVQTEAADFDSLPFDVLHEARRDGRCLRLSMNSLFPDLSPSVLRTLDRRAFDLLFAAQSQDPPNRPLGASATRDYVLSHVYGLSAETITSPAGLLRVLLRWHYRGFCRSSGLAEHLLQALRRTARWNDWPLEKIVPSRRLFFAFLNERWPFFVRRANGTIEPTVSCGTDNLLFSGPLELPFGHPDVRVYIDKLFQEGQLEPAAGYRTGHAPEEWMRVGVRADDPDRYERSRRLRERLESELPPLSADHREWVEFAWVWAEWLALRWGLGPTGPTPGPLGKDAGGGEPPQVGHDAAQPLHDLVEARFAEWMAPNFATLHNLSVYERPAMVHHVPHHMALSLTATSSPNTSNGPAIRQALMVVDGLALDQWIVLRNALAEQLDTNVELEEDACFAWVPTLTSVSRRAIFSGREPFSFKTGLAHTRRESRCWTTLWEEYGLRQSEIGYLIEGRNRLDAHFLAEVHRAADDHRLRVLGIVVNKIDEAMHGTTTGSGGLHAIVRQWAQGGTFGQLLGILTERDFRVVVTADHGNIEAVGMGRLDAGALVGERSVRAHVFRNENTRAAAAARFQGTIEWPRGIGLPTDCFPLLAPGRRAFLKEGRHAVGHGGISLEEVIVPFVRVQKTAR